MAFILSTATTVSAPFKNAFSVNTSVNSQQELLYQLANSNPVYDTLISFQTVVSVSIYAPGPFYNTLQSVDCQAANVLRLKVVPGFCGAAIRNLQIDDSFFVSSYSYSKERDTYGTETWSLTSKPKVLDGNGELQYESEMFRGIATGTATGGAKNSVGVKFSGTLTKSSQMSVQAAFPGVGTANELYFGRVIQIGGGVGEGSTDGQAEVSIPYIPVPNDVSISRSPRNSIKTLK